MSGPLVSFGPLKIRISKFWTEAQVYLKELSRPKNIVSSQIQNLRSATANSKSICQKNHSKKFLIFNAASKPLKFSCIVYYSRSTSDNFGNYYTYFQLEFFDVLHIFGILGYNICNKILNLEQSAHFYFSPTLALLGCKRCKKPKLRINQTTPKLKSYY